MAEAVAVRRRYVDGPFGQIHVRVSGVGAAAHSPLLCLHMCPKSGRQFERFLAEMASDFHVAAPDYPGHGESDGLAGNLAPTIGHYADAMLAVCDALSWETFDVLGFHTGALVATDLATRWPARVRRLVLFSAPVLDESEAAAFTELYAPVPLDEAGSRFRRIWDSVVKHRGPGMTLPMMAESFAESLRGGDDYELGHAAAFRYAPRFAAAVGALAQPLTVVNPGDDLAEISRRIIPFIGAQRFVEKPEWGHGLFDAHTGAVASTVRELLGP
ncbi:MAG: alpha/beta hydrolase [Pseudomonadota bacterium]